MGLNPFEEDSLKSGSGQFLADKLSLDELSKRTLIRRLKPDENLRSDAF